MKNKGLHQNLGHLIRRKTKNGLIYYTLMNERRSPPGKVQQKSVNPVTMDEPPRIDAEAPKVEATKIGDRTESTADSNDDNAQERSPDQPLFIYASKEEVQQAYLAVEQEWEEVFRRLADS